MRGNMVKSGLMLACVAMMISCTQGRTEQASTPDGDTVTEDTLEADTTLIYEEVSEGLSLDRHPTEVFGDFMFAFTHDTRFQAGRVRFPLPVTDIDGTERTISSGRQFRSEFQLPGNDYYTLLLGERSQMDVLQGDTALSRMELQCIRLSQLTMTCYRFQRTDGRWYLTSRADSHVPPQLIDFLRFYDQFSTDTLFQQECLAPQLTYTMDDPDEEESDIEGTIDSGQWPAFRPEMPYGEFVSINFGQTFPHPDRIYLLQCGISDGMLDIFTFRHEGDRWRLTSYEN